MKKLSLFSHQSWVGLGLCVLLVACTPRTEPPTPEKIPTGVVIPETGAYTGAYMDFGDAEDVVTIETIEKFENLVGKKQAIVASSSFWGEQSFPRQNLQTIALYGALPLIYWSPWDKPYMQDRGTDQFALDAILAGKWDDYIDKWGAGAKAYGRPFMVAWGLEMNGTWFPWSGWFYGGRKVLASKPEKIYAGSETWKRAYRHVVDRVRAQGATNVIWVFHVNNYPYPWEAWNTADAYYPGSQYVDWLAMSVYGKQFKKDPWVTWVDAMDYPYQQLCNLDPNKPIMLAEWGIGEFPKSGDRAAWIAQGLKEMTTKYPRLKAAVFWHERWQNSDNTYSNLRVNTSPETLEAYRHGVADPFWLDRPQWK
jgi:hypothetical protein